MTFSVRVERDVQAIAYNLLGLILVLHDCIAAWQLNSAMASHIAKKKFDINKVHRV